MCVCVCRVVQRMHTRTTHLAAQCPGGRQFPSQALLACTFFTDLIIKDARGGQRKGKYSGKNELDLKNSTNVNGTLVPISSTTDCFLTHSCVPECTSAWYFFFFFYPFCQQLVTGGAPNMQAAKTSHYSRWCVRWLRPDPPPLLPPLPLHPAPKTPSITHRLKLTCWWTSSFSESSLNIKEHPHIHDHTA